MHFCHAQEIWTDFPELVAGALFVTGITTDAPVDRQVAEFDRTAASRLAESTESRFPEVQAWRRAFSRMGLKPTQYRCASESLLRRFRQDGSLPRIHPLIDLCNAISIASGIPIAVFDSARIADHLEVRYATGTEDYLTFSGESEHPAEHEVVFADGAGRAHARRWTNRQSGHSAVGASTSSALIVAEGLHESAYDDVRSLTATIAGALGVVWSADTSSAVLDRPGARFEF